MQLSKEKKKEFAEVQRQLEKHKMKLKRKILKSNMSSSEYEY